MLLGVEKLPASFALHGARAVEGDVDVRVVDSKSITAGLGTLLILAAEAAAGGAGADEVVAVIEAAIPRTRVIGGLDTLENLRKGGRIGGAQAMLGTMLSIKPVIDISTGVDEEEGKVRTRKKQMAFIRDKLVASFAAVFPADGPLEADRYFVLIMMDEPHGTKETYGFRTGGFTAAPAAGRVIERIAPFLDVRRRADVGQDAIKILHYSRLIRA